MLIIYHVVVLHTDQLNTGEGFTIFATCSNEWCLQKGLQKPQHKNSSTNSEKLCEKYGGVYVSHITVGTMTYYAVCGCKYYDDPRNWHWCDLKDGYWYNHSLDYYKTSNNFITSITCINRPLKPSKAVEESNSIVDEPNDAQCSHRGGHASIRQKLVILPNFLGHIGCTVQPQRVSCIYSTKTGDSA